MDLPRDTSKKSLSREELIKEIRPDPHPAVASAPYVDARSKVVVSKESHLCAAALLAASVASTRSLSSDE